MEDYKGLKCPNPNCTAKPGEFKTGQQKKEQDIVHRPMTCKVCGTVFWTIQVPTCEVTIHNNHLSAEQLAAIASVADQAGIITAPVEPGIGKTPVVPAVSDSTVPVVPAVPAAPITHPIPPTSLLNQPATLASLPQIPLGEVSGQMVRAFMDGDYVCVVREGFVDIRVSKAGFGATAELAVADLLNNETGVQA